MSVHDIYSKAYAQGYLDSHKDAKDESYRKQYWNHFFLDRMINPSLSGDSHLLEEGGGTCGVWNSLSYNRYTSVDLSPEMTETARALHVADKAKEFILGDIHSGTLPENEYSAIIANAYGVYYRPNFKHLKRFYDLSKRGGVLFVAIDPVQNIKHVLAAPFAKIINKHVRTYTRISSSEFVRMAEKAGFRVWMTTDYTPSPGWKRRAFFLMKD